MGTLRVSYGAHLLGYKSDPDEPEDLSWSLAGRKNQVMHPE